MSAGGGVPRAWGAWLGALEVDAIEREVRDELEAHLEHAIAERVSNGLDTEDARREARAAFGDIERTVRDCVRQRLGGRLMLAKIHLTLTALLFVGLGLTIRQSYAVQAQLKHEANEARALAAELAQSRSEPREIRIGVGDRITLLPTYQQDLRLTTTVEQDGTVLVPPAGRMDAYGLSREAFEARLNEALTPYYELAEVYVRVEQD